MALQNVITPGIDDVAHCVKVDDAAPGISEGLHAGMWSVGLAVSGNEFGATGRSTGRCRKRKSPPAASGRQANCMPPGRIMWLIPADLPEVIADINARLAKGERP